MGRQKFVQFIRIIYLGFIDLNRTVVGQSGNLLSKKNIFHMQSKPSEAYALVFGFCIEAKNQTALSEIGY